MTKVYSRDAKVQTGHVKDVPFVNRRLERGLFFVKLNGG